MPRYPAVPAMLPHSSGQARVILSGRTVYLGRWGTQEAADAYERSVAAWLAAGRVWPPPGALNLSVADLAERYRRWAVDRYRKGGRPTKHALNIARATTLLELSGLGKLDACTFAPRHLRHFQHYLAADPASRWNRKTINEYVGIVVGMLAWAVGEELFGEPRDFVPMVEALRLVKPLRKGSAPAPGVRPPRESRKVDAVALERVKAVQQALPPTLAAMIKVQLLTGMRPTELVHLRPADLAPTPLPDVFVYNVRDEGNKTAHREIVRQVFIGPKAHAALRPHLAACPPDAYVFQPRRVSLEADSARRASRATPRYPSHDPAARRLRRGSGPIPFRDRYTTCGYGRAIRRACERLKVAAWSPHQLRHAAASYIAAAEDVTVAQLILGHTSIATTMRYVHTDAQRAAEAMQRHG